jgi:hypothetical protein
MCARQGAIDPQAQVQRAESDRDRPAGPEQVCRDRATEEAVVESQRGDVPPTSTGEPVQAPDQRGLTRRAVLRYADLQVFLWVTHRLRSEPFVHTPLVHAKQYDVASATEE